ncbi:MAG: DNA translocase FtsK 4TM domain-containing protein [Opitutales bacterium]
MKSKAKKPAAAKKRPEKKKAKTAPPPKEFRKGRPPKGTLKSEDDPTVKTSFGQRTPHSKPVLGLVLLTLTILLGVSFLTYTPGQDYFLRVSADGSEGGVLGFLSNTTEVLETGNPVGPTGATLAALGYYFLGAVVWLIPVFFLWSSFLCFFKRAQFLRWWKWGLFIPTLGLCAGVARIFQGDPNSVVSGLFLKGWGGLIGDGLHGQLLGPVLGPFGSGFILVSASLIALTAIFIESPGHAWDSLTAALRKRAQMAAEKKAQRKAEKAEAAPGAAPAAASSEALRGGNAEADPPLLRRPGLTRPAIQAPPPPGIKLSRPGFSDEQRREMARRRLSLGEARQDTLAPIPPSQRTPVTQGSEASPAATSGGDAAASEGGNKQLPSAPRARGMTTPPMATSTGPSKPSLSPPEKPDVKVISGERVEKAENSVPERRGDHVFPSVDLLAEPPDEAPTTEEDHRATADLLVQILDQFGVRVEPSEVQTGPVITRYEVKPAAGVRVEKIENLDKNIALGLKATAVRILAPVPGKGTVGVEVPNQKPSQVCIREIIESKAWASSKAEIPIVLGKEVTGRPVVADLTKMPHLLIAGATGAGKTVCINAIVASLLYHSSPEDLRFIMVDPKIVEMQVFNSLPHMLIPVVTQPKKVPGALKWLIGEMERRYQIFAQVGVRNIAGFNAKILKDKEEKAKADEMDASMSPEERAALGSIEVPRDVEFEIPERKLPYIVCIIDELADLMMVAPADIEQGIARLAQLARAAGIHLIIATQRPSVNVITGVIKANLPSRIAFKVASKVDSRTILDGQGADKLIGKGDMLFLPPGTASMVRAQGAFVSDEEINAIVQHQSTNGPPHYVDDVQAHVDAEGEEDAFDKPGSEREWEDDLVPDALEVLRVSKRASTSMLQRRLKIGYNRAARIMEILEAEGIVGPENGSSPREILQDIDAL